MRGIDEIKRMFAKKVTIFLSGGFRPTNSDTEYWRGESIPYQICLEGLLISL